MASGLQSPMPPAEALAKHQHYMDSGIMKA